ncbi:DNA methyltransferase [Salinisphaera sp.]|uniref:DNA methyltransferase n=1 Tax=Salinisphaera sp. TaxID=1914330 RepID=UPI002D7961AE|nr:DNA methyltransferase [Salinisphaera sp.]HET7313228.1 DNA methyltransferase [Salinisphaera sp.]
MPLSWNEIRDRATAFAHEWADESYERGEAQTFWNEFFRVFGVDRRRVGTFEKHVKKLDDRGANRHGFIDCFWPGTLIAEHKSLGKDLDSAYLQALDYFATLKDRDLPRYVVVSDFATIRLYDLDDNTHAEFALRDLPKQIKRFGFIAGYKPQILRAEDPVNVKAAERMGRLHDALKASGYADHPLEMLLVRLLFCLFAEDTGIFQPAQAFRQWLEDWTIEDGSDLGSKLAHAFQILNTPHHQRLTSLDEQLAAFPYVNGRLFEEPLPIAAFDSSMRDALLDACALDWSQISPAVFGAMFQSIMDGEARRSLGAHYTSEQNIEKLIKPLFLDDLRAEFERVKHNRNKLFGFHKKLRTLTFLDPACGCGNFLVVTYRALRELELDVLRAASSGSGQLSLDVHSFINIDVDQFFGIEIEEFPARIAEVALWLTDHQMNVKVGEEFGLYFARIPLRATPHIHHANALRMDWEDVIPRQRLSYILGNPPFGGKHYQSKTQRADQSAVTTSIKSGSDLDFVACWFIKAADFTEDSDTTFAFVSTNSISQGEQVPLLWGYLLGCRGLHIHFAHRTFKWSNEARGQAAVHCVIIGLGRNEPKSRLLFDYDGPTAEPQVAAVASISPYLTAGPEDFVSKRQTPIQAAPTMRCGSKPTDGGHLLLDADEKAALLAEAPAAAPYIRQLVGSREFLNGGERFCLWLVGASPKALRSMPAVLERVEKVRAFRQASSAKPTRAAADRAAEFFYVNQPESAYILIPEVSSQRRAYIPLGWMSPDIVSTNKNYLIAEPSKYLFGLLQSAMHMAWLGAVSGRLKSDFQYSATMVYNNFPRPDAVSNAKHHAVEQAADTVLAARAEFPDSTLADLYDPLTMPPALLKAHRALDKAVDAAYGRRKLTGNADRVAFLFAEYARLTRTPHASG